MKTFFIIFSFFVLMLALSYQSLIAWDVRNVRDSSRAYSQFIRDAAARECLRKDSLIAAADSRGWDYEDSPEPPFESYSPDGYHDSIRVFMVPQLNFAKEPGVRFFFNENDCLIFGT